MPAAGAADIPLTKIPLDRPEASMIEPRFDPISAYRLGNDDVFRIGSRSNQDGVAR